MIGLVLHLYGSFLASLRAIKKQVSVKSCALIVLLQGLRVWPLSGKQFNFFQINQTTQQFPCNVKGTV